MESNPSKSLQLRSIQLARAAKKAAKAARRERALAAAKKSAELRRTVGFSSHAMAADAIILYSNCRSSCSWRVRAALAFKEIDFELRTVDIEKGEQNSEEYRKVNPSGFVPALIHKDRVITESLAIMEYLEEQFPKKAKLLPKNAENRALVRSLCLSIVAAIQPLQIPRVYTMVSKEESKQMEFIHYFINLGLSILDERLKTSSGKYSVGDEITMVDICLVPQMYNAENKFGMDITKYTNCFRIYKNLIDLPFIVKSHPNAQPDKK